MCPQPSGWLQSTKKFGVAHACRRDTIVALIDKSEIRDLEVFVEWSRYDFPVIDEKPVDARDESRRLVEMLEKKGYSVTTREVPHGRGWAAWRLGTDRILETLFPLAASGTE